SAYQALMRTFQEALVQDEMDAMEYLDQQLTAELIDELREILRDDLETMRPALRNGLSADLVVVQKQSERQNGILDIEAELIAKALELRQRHLGRLRQEIIAMFADDQLDWEDMAYYSQIATLTNIAKRLIDDEISRQARRVNA